MLGEALPEFQIRGKRKHSPGHLLIASDHNLANTSMLHSLLAAAYSLNTPQEINLHIISAHLTETHDLLQQEHLKISFEPEQKNAELLIEELVNLAKKRMEQGSFESVHIFAIDELERLSENLSRQSLSYLHWLIDNGAHQGIWVFATYNTIYNTPRYKKLTASFTAKLVGPIENSRLAQQLTGCPADELATLHPGMEALLITEKDNYRIWIPQLESDPYE